MLIHYCVIAFKNIWKYKVSASISILGLAFALVCFVPILYWMDHETTYDSFYKDSESIYRVYSAEKLCFTKVYNLVHQECIFRKW